MTRISKPADAPPADDPPIRIDQPGRINKTGENTYDKAMAGLTEFHFSKTPVGQRPIDTEMKARMAACIALRAEKLSAQEIADTLSLSIWQVRGALSRARREMTREQAFTDAIERVDRDIVPLAVDRLHDKVHEGKRWAIQDVLFGRRVLQKQEAKAGGGGAAPSGQRGTIVQINIVPNEKRPDVQMGTIVGQALSDPGEVVEALSINLLPPAESV